METKKEHTTEKKGKKFKGLFSYEWVLNNTGFFLFLSLLAIVYIANGHYADKTLRNINNTQKELKELQYEYKTLKGELMQKSLEKEVAAAAEKIGLQLSSEPPQRIVLEKRNK